MQASTTVNNYTLGQCQCLSDRTNNEYHVIIGETLNGYWEKKMCLWIFGMVAFNKKVEVKLSKHCAIDAVIFIIMFFSIHILNCC